MGDGCRIQMKINPDGEVNWQLKIQVGANSSIKCKTIQNVQAESMGVPSKIKAVKVFDANEVELTDVVVTNSDDPPEVSKKQKTEIQPRKSSIVFSSSEHHHKGWARSNKSASICRVVRNRRKSNKSVCHPHSVGQRRRC